MTGPKSASRTVDPADIARFSAIAGEWWDPLGKFRPLHRINPVRLAFIRDHIAAHFGRDVKSPLPLKGLRALDIGCGGGLLTEPICRLGAEVIGADAGEKNIAAASMHAEAQNLSIDYRCTTAEALAADGELFDVILNMEVIEHVSDRALFLSSCAAMLKPGGIMVVSTLNRTLKALGLAVIGAEYILRWLPRGTHDWSKFVTPEEMQRDLESAGLSMQQLTGVVYNPLFDSWSLSRRDTAVNYMALALKD